MSSKLLLIILTQIALTKKESMLSLIWLMKNFLLILILIRLMKNNTALLQTDKVLKLSMKFQKTGIGEHTMVSHQSRIKDTVEAAGHSPLLVLLKLIAWLNSQPLTVFQSNNSLTAQVPMITMDAMVVFHLMLLSILLPLVVLAQKLLTHTSQLIELVQSNQTLLLLELKVDLLTSLKVMKWHLEMLYLPMVQFLLHSKL